MLSRLRDASNNRNKDLAKSINEQLTKIKYIVKNVPKNDKLKIKENEKIIDIVERTLELNSENQLGKGLKILTPNQMLSRLPISLAQLKAGNNSEKHKNEIRQLLYSLYCSKNMTKQIYNNLIKHTWIKNIIIIINIIITIIIIIITIVTIKGIHYKKWIK